MSEWEEAKSRLGYRSKAMLTSSADKWDQQTGADIRAALERVQELEGLIVALVPPPPPERARAVMRALIREATALAPAEVKP